MKLRKKLITFFSVVLLVYLGLSLYCNLNLDCMEVTAEGIRDYLLSFIW